LFLMGFGLTAGALGSPGAAYGQESVCQANPSPVNASDPSIIVTSPTSGSAVASPIQVAGQARVFEATVSVKLLDSSGGVLADTTTQAAEGQTLSPFSASVSFSVPTSTSACLWVFEVSAKDGSPVNVVQIPLTLQPVALPPGGAGHSGQAPHWPVALLAAAGIVLAGSAMLVRRAKPAR
jgi:hypothetical protein